MEGDFKKKKGSELARKYEEGLKRNQSLFFDLEDYEELVLYYSNQNLPKKALQATKHAESQHPFSVELMLLKAQAFINLENYTEALEVLATAETFQPNEAEIFMLRGSLYSIKLHSKKRRNSSIKRYYLLRIKPMFITTSVPWLRIRKNMMRQ